MIFAKQRQTEREIKALRETEKYKQTRSEREKLKFYTERKGETKRETKR